MPFCRQAALTGMRSFAHRVSGSLRISVEFGNCMPQRTDRIRPMWLFADRYRVTLQIPKFVWPRWGCSIGSHPLAPGCVSFDVGMVVQSELSPRALMICWLVGRRGFPPGPRFFRKHTRGSRSYGSRRSRTWVWNSRPTCSPLALPRDFGRVVSNCYLRKTFPAANAN